MQIFVKKFYGFNPNNIPVITFSQRGSRDRLLEKAQPGDRILYVATRTGDVKGDSQGKILGMAEIGDGAVNANDFIQDRSILPDDYFDAEGKLIWAYGIPMKKAWRLDPPVDRLKYLTKETVDKQSARRNAVLISDEEQQAILKLDFQEIQLPDVSTLLNSQITSFANPKKSNEQKRIFGHLNHVPVGTIFENRRALAAAGIHKPLISGISGSGTEGADSIVVSGGYEDDEDLGNVIIYTGHGGNDPNTGRQIADQLYKQGNLALALNERLGLPVRVVRGFQGDPKTSPVNGYRYDGLFRVASHWQEMGRSGYKIFRYRLEQDEAGLSSDISVDLPNGRKSPERVEITTLRLVRDSKLARRIKEYHSFKCQVCGIAVKTDSGFYAEGAHIVPLGKPHNGEDVPENILCLCPNHHASFDQGGFSINDDLTLIGEKGSLRFLKGHSISLESLKHHRKRYRFE